MDRLYWKRSEGGRGLQSISDTVRLEVSSLGFYLKDSKEVLLKEVIKEKMYLECTDPKKRKEELIQIRKDTYDEKKLHSALLKNSEECRDDKDSCYS